MECSGNYAYAPRLSCYGFPKENINPHLQRMRFPLENIYQYVIASNLFVNRDLFDFLCIIIAIVGHKWELSKSAKINGAIYTYISGCKGVFKGGGFRGFKPPPEIFRFFFGKLKEKR